MDTTRSLAFVALVATVPVAIVLVVALLRGYDIHLDMIRRHRGRDREDDP